MVGILDFLRGAEVPNRLAAAGQPAPGGNALQFWNGDINDAVANNGDRLVRMPDGSVQRTSAKYGWSEIDRGGAPQGGGGILGMSGSGNDMPEPSNVNRTGPQVSRGNNAPQGGGILSGLGGLLEGILGGQRGPSQSSINWVQNLGYSPAAAQAIASDPASLRRLVIAQGSPQPASEFQQRQQALRQAGIDMNSAEGREYFLTGKLSDQKEPNLTDDIREYQYARNNGQFQGSFTDWQTKGVREQGADFGRYQDVRKEIQGLPSYKNYSQAAPIYKTMLDASKRDTKAADLNLVYGLGKIFDPGSVVREGEMVMVKDTASLPDWLIGSIQSLNGGARLQPETRAAILAEARSRIGSYRDLIDTDMTQYRELATQFNLDPKFLLPPMEDIEEPPAPPKLPQPGSDGQTPSQAGRRTRSGVEWRLDQ